ncbi:retention module-containing protein, partial [Halomonas sp. I1]|uniref:retention module-containing protein n=1 Tax=Halomonas sp. I1 TaxID=393536 RepID=UPI0028E03D6A
MAIATVVSITGQAWARDSQGNLRELHEGDALREGETLVTADNATVELDFGDAFGPTTIGGGETVAMTPDLDAGQPVSVDEASAQDEDLEALLTAIEQGNEDLLEGLEDPAAGNGGAQGGGGHDFVRLARISEQVDPLSFDFGSVQPGSDDTLEGAALADTAGDVESDNVLAVDDAFVTSEGAPLSGANVLLNDSDSDGDPLTVADPGPRDVIFTMPDGSTVSVTVRVGADGSVSFDPSDGFQALDDDESASGSLSYEVTDGNGNSDSAQVTVTVTGETDAPPVVDIDDGAPGLANADLTVTEATGNTVTGTATVGAEAGIDSVTVNDQDITGATSANPVTIPGAEGELRITGYNAATGEISYDYTEDGDAEDHSDGEIFDRFDLEVTDLAGESTTDSLDIRIEDTEPAAGDDSAAIGEDDTDAVTGNVLANDTESADTPSAISFDADDVAAAQYGTFVDNGDGNWTYQVDTTNGAVQALDDDDTLTETFTYTLTDADGDTSTATLTVTINGATDGPPTVDIDDKAPNAEGADHSVVEATGNTISGTATVGAEAGIDSVTVEGQDITDASNTPVTLQGDEGTLTITGYNAATGEITYDYTEDGDAEDHGNGEILDQFTLGVTDLAGESTSDSLDIRIEDTEPAASDDSAAIGEDDTDAVTGNVLDNDTESADTPSEVVFTDTSASYGSFVDNGDGNWTYQVDTTNGAVQALDDGESLTETFTYTLTDADGDTSTATLTVTINGATDGPPTVDIDDKAPNAEGADHSVVEATG